MGKSKKKKLQQWHQAPLSPMQRAFGVRRAYAMVEAANIVWCHRVENQKLMREYVDTPKDDTAKRMNILRIIAAPRNTTTVVADQEFIHYVNAVIG